jgi:hypothetical protein
MEVLVEKSSINGPFPTAMLNMVNSVVLVVRHWRFPGEKTLKDLERLVILELNPWS